jgi:hypothetical protein
MSKTQWGEFWTPSNFFREKSKMPTTQGRVVGTFDFWAALANSRGRIQVLKNSLKGFWASFHPRNTSL